MKTENQLEILKKIIAATNGFNAILTETSDKETGKKLRRIDPSMHLHTRFVETKEGYLAVFDLDAECLECSLDNRRFQTALLTGVEIRDFGMALILRTEEHYYLFNLESPLPLQG